MSTYKHFEVGWTSTYGQYIPPDFNPEVLRKHKVSKKMSTDGFAVRNMLPFTVVCTRCGAHMARGTKFNMRGEKMQHCGYLGQLNVLFTFHCAGCSGKCQFRTDYEHSTYEVETGCRMHNEPFKRQAVEDRKTQAELDEEDAMKRLERQTEQLKNSSAMQEQVDDLLRLNKRQGVTNTDEIREALRNKRARDEGSNEENVDDAIVFRQKRLELEAEKKKINGGFFKGMFGAPGSNKVEISEALHLTDSVVREVECKEEPFLVVKSSKKSKRNNKRKKKKRKKVKVAISL